MNSFGQVVSGAAPRLRRGFGGQAPPFRPPAGGFAGGIPCLAGRQARPAVAGRNAFGLIQKYCTNLERNLAMQKGLVVAEPLYIILAAQGHPDAHEKVRTLTLQAQREARPLEEVVLGDAEMKDYLERMTLYQRQILSNPFLYTGIAAKKAKAVAARWKQKLGL